MLLPTHTNAALVFGDSVDVEPPGDSSNVRLFVPEMLLTTTEYPMGKTAGAETLNVIARVASGPKTKRRKGRNDCNVVLKVSEGM